MMLMFIKYAAIGFGSGFILIVLSKVILAAILQRKPDYYDCLLYTSGQAAASH